MGLLESGIDKLLGNPTTTRQDLLEQAKKHGLTGAAAEAWVRNTARQQAGVDTAFPVVPTNPDDKFDRESAARTVQPETLLGDAKGADGKTWLERPGNMTAKTHEVALKAFATEITRGKTQSVFTAIETYVLQDGARNGTDSINPQNWRLDTRKAVKDLQALAQKFPEFAALMKASGAGIATMKPDDPAFATSLEKAHIDLLADYFVGRQKSNAVMREERTKLSKEMAGPGMVGTVLDEAIKSPGKCLDAIQKGDYKSAAIYGAVTLLAATLGIAAWKGLSNLRNSDDGMVATAGWAATVGAVLGGVFMVAKPAEASRGSAVRERMNNPALSDDVRALMKIPMGGIALDNDPETREWYENLAKDPEGKGVESFLGLMNVPVKECLDWYEAGAADQQIDPKKVARFAEGKGKFKKWQKDAISQMDPRILYKVLGGTIQCFGERYEREKNNYPGKDLTGYLRDKYVTYPEQHGGLTIHFQEFLADAVQPYLTDPKFASLSITASVSSTVSASFIAPAVTAAPAATPPDTVKLGAVEFKTGDTIHVRGRSPLALVNPDFTPTPRSVIPLQPGVDVVIDGIVQSPRGQSHARIVQPDGSVYLVPLHPLGKTNQTYFEKAVVAPPAAAPTPASVPVTPPTPTAQPPTSPLPAGGSRRGSAPPPRP